MNFYEYVAVFFQGISWPFGLATPSQFAINISETKKIYTSQMNIETPTGHYLRNFSTAIQYYTFTHLYLIVYNLV